MLAGRIAECEQAGLAIDHDLCGTDSVRCAVCQAWAFCFRGVVSGFLWRFRLPGLLFHRVICQGAASNIEARRGLL
ncbi:MAG TPA: hypothetical protein DEP36_15830 [Gammaproteobacteria bacterium]|nr:hypothetical protein [Gammaproteobacteria bacterium]